jgi:cholesterol transport system auxiliary component
LKRAPLEKRYFTIEARRRAEPREKILNAALELRPLRVSPQYDRPGFVYRLGELDYEADFYNEFFVPPGPMIAGETARWIADSGLFERVVDSGAMGAPTHVLEGAVVTLLGDYLDRDRPVATIEMQFLLARDVGSGFVFPFQRTYLHGEPLDEPTPAGLARAWSRALEAILMQLEIDLVAELTVLEAEGAGSDRSARRE